MEIIEGYSSSPDNNRYGKIVTDYKWCICTYVDTDLAQNLKEGKTIVDILADGTRLQCMVKVSERPIPPYDFSKELSDNRCRFSSQSLTLYYDTPGNIFSIWDNRKIEIINLDSLHHILFDAKENITTNGQQLSPTLTINNIEIPISEATVEEHSTRGTWFNILTESHERIVIAITNL